MDNNTIMKTEMDAIMDELSSHVVNPFLFRKNPVQPYFGVRFEKTDWSSKNMRRIHFSDCFFLNTNFQSTGFTGAIFRNCSFKNCNLDCAIFDECIFINCTFDTIELNTTSFCNATLVYCKMVNLVLKACFFTESKFLNSFVIDCNIIDIIWEHALFSHSVFENVTLKKLNMEFTRFDNMHFKNMSLPFVALPFIFGGMNYINNTQDTVFIKTVNKEYTNGYMTKEEYLKLLPKLLSFYQKTNNYFPLANILLGNNRINEGIQAICDGLLFWHQFHNYKTMYYLCELTNTYNFSIEQRQKVYQEVEKINVWMLEHENWDFQERWSEYFSKMRNILLDFDHMPQLSITIKTSIKENDYSTLSDFMQMFEKNILPLNQQMKLEIRHNSPFELLYTLFSDPETLFNTVVGVATILGVCNQIYSNHISNRLKKQTTHKNNNETEPQTNNIIINNIESIQYNFYNCKSFDGNNVNHFTKHNIGCENPDSSGSNQ